MREKENGEVVREEISANTMEVMAKLYFLGTGTSTGVPQMGCGCPVCRSTDPHDRRLRTSALLETEAGRRILIDCGPDFRQQLLALPFKPLGAVLLTHEHYDHVGGLDDLRPFSVFGRVDVYADAYCAKHLLDRIPYCFVEHKYPGVPNIALHTVQPGVPFSVAGVEVLPLRVMHGKLLILGYRIGSLGYVTDMSAMDACDLERLRGVQTLVVNALRLEPHHSHQSLGEALQMISSLSPQESYLIHASHQIGLHAEVSAQLPPHVHLAYDGLQIPVRLSLAP